MIPEEHREGPPYAGRIMAESSAPVAGSAPPVRSLADALRRADDASLAHLLTVRDDLARTTHGGIGVLAARAAASGSVRRALPRLTAPQLQVLEALAVLDLPASAETISHALSTAPPVLAPVLDELRSLALVWGDDAVSPVRAVLDLVRSPGGLAPRPASGSRAPAPTAAERIAVAPAAARPLLDALAEGPSHVDADPRSPVAQSLLNAGILEPSPDGTGLQIPRDVHLALRGGRVHRAFAASPPEVDGPAVAERFPGARTAQAVDAAIESMRIAETPLDWADDAPHVLRRGGLPQRDQRQLAAAADTDPARLAVVLHTLWRAGLVGHDGEQWRPAPELADETERPLAVRWAALVLGWRAMDDVPSLAGAADASGSPRALLSNAVRVPGAGRRRAILLAALADAPESTAAAADLASILAWHAPLLDPRAQEAEAGAFLAEATALGLVLDGALTALGAALALTDDRDPVAAESVLADALAPLLPAEVDEVLLDADLTVTVPGRPSPRVHEILAWTVPESRGGALTARFTPPSVRGALAGGADPERLLSLLADASRTPVPQALAYLIADERRRHGSVSVARASSVLTAEEEVLARFSATPQAEALALRLLAPTVAITTSDPAFVLEMVRRSGLRGIAVGPDGRPAPDPGAAVSARSSLELADDAGDHDRLPSVSAQELVARLRAAEGRPTAETSVADRLLEAIADGRTLEIGIVDGRGSVTTRKARPLSLEGGRLRARNAQGDGEFTVLVHRVTLG